MAATVSGSKTVTIGVAPHLSAPVLTLLMATAVENLTVAQLNMLRDAIDRIGKGAPLGSTLGSLLQ